MVLKNKDGTVYKISGPNPLMMRQDFWDGFKKHNFEWTTEKTELEEIEIIKKEVKLKEIKIEKPIKEIKSEVDLPKFQTEQKEIKIIEQPKIEQPKIEQPKESQNKKISDYKTIQSYCLPANSVERTDELYGEKYTKTEYLNAFTFENVIIEKEDFYIKFWTNIDYIIAKNSIIYPRNKEKRWWKVLTKEDAPQGKIYTACVSDYTPSFE